MLLNPEQEKGYEQEDFVPGQAINSTYFPTLNVSVDEILYPPTVEELMKIEQTRIQQLQEQRDEAQVQLDQVQQQRNDAQERAEKLAALLREQGIDPDKLSII